MIAFIVIVIIVMLLLAAGIVFFVVLYQRKIIRHQLEIKKINEQRQQELIRASLESEERERIRVAAELHDDVGATLSSVRLYLYAAANKPGDINAINQSKQLLDESIKKVRNISHKLQPTTLEALGLDASLASLANIIDRSGTVAMRYSAQPPIPRTDGHKAQALYRIIQELTNNVIRHAAAKNLYLHAGTDADNMVFRLEHNGQGITQDEFLLLVTDTGANGLKNIVNRLSAIHATVRFYKDRQDLYGIVLTVPV